MLLNCSIVLVAKIIYFYDAMFQLLSRRDLNKHVNASRSVVVCCIRDFYRPPTKLREGNVFSRVCLFTWSAVVQGPGSCNMYLKNKRLNLEQNIYCLPFCCRTDE